MALPVQLTVRSLVPWNHHALRAVRQTVVDGLGIGVGGHDGSGTVVVHNAAYPGADAGIEVVVCMIVLKHGAPHGGMAAGGIAGQDHPGGIDAETGRVFPQKTDSVAGIHRLGRPMADIQSAIENTGNVEVSRLEKGLPILASIAGGAPMIGFLGTVLGMVKAFFNMSKAGNNIDITLLSDGIYTAMLTTVGGLVVGIIAYFGYNWLTSKVSNLVYKMESSTMQFIDIVLHEPGEE